MNRESDFFGKARRRVVAIVSLAALSAVCGCNAMPGAKKQERIDEGLAAAQHQALAKAQAQATSGAPALQGTSSMASLTSEEGNVQFQAPAVVSTAPPPDKFDNKNPEHLLARCRDRSARHEWFDAIGDCRAAYDLNPASIEPQVELMRLLVTLQSYSEAEESARKVLVAKPNDPVALYYLAWSFRGREQFTDATDALQRAIALDPKRVEFVEALAVTYRLAGNYGKSFETLEKALTLRPGDAKLQSMVTETRLELNEKLSPYFRLVKEKPDSWDNQAALGFMLQKYGLPQKALTAYDTALARIPTPLASQESETKKIGAQIYYNRGVVYRDLGRSELAEPAFWQSMQIDPSLASVAWYSIGLCRYDLGKFDTSIDALRKSIDLAPDVAENRAALGDAYEKAGNAALATEQHNAAAAIRARATAAKQAVAKEALAAEQTPKAASGAAPASGASAPAPAASPAAAASASPPAAPSAMTAPTGAAKP